VRELPGDARFFEQLFGETRLLRERAREPLDDDERLHPGGRSLEAELNFDGSLHPDPTEKYVPPKRDRLAGTHDVYR
jgi:hypothetical protein